MKINSMFPEWNDTIGKANTALEKMGLGATIDEVAVLFPSHEEAMLFIGNAVKQDGVTLFNSATDDVSTFPFNTEYAVSYYFLTTPYGYRVEAMALDGGYSPLHEALLRNNHRSSTTVHFSFKVPDLTTYKRACDFLRAYGWHEAQGCLAAYGTFSYWMLDPKVAQDNFDFPPGVYLKPRVNTRDEAGTVSQAALDYLESKA